MRTGLSLSSSLSNGGWLSENSSPRNRTMHRLGVSTRRSTERNSKGGMMIREEAIREECAGKENLADDFIPLVKVRSKYNVISDNFSFNRENEQSCSRIFRMNPNFSDFQASTRSSKMLVMLCTFNFLFYSSKTMKTTRIFLLPMIKKRNFQTTFFVSKRKKINFHATRSARIHRVASRLVSIGEFQFKSMPCSKNQSSSKH